MILRNFICLLVAVGGGLFFLAVPSLAQGIIIPIPCDIRPCRPPRPNPPRPVLPNVLPVKSIKLKTTIEGQVATTAVEQVFINETGYTLEGTYFFPIPESAAVVEFAIWENGKRLAGEVRSREEARRIYDGIVRQQRDPGLLEYAGRDLLQATVFPIPARSEKKIELTYTQVLKAEAGTVAYRYPLGSGRNIWRQLAEDRQAQPLQRRIGTVSGTVEIKGGGPLRNIFSPTHKLDVTHKGDSRALLSFETENNDNDLQLFYTISDANFGLSLLTHREPGKDGYFMLMLSPKDDLNESELVNKDIVFVLDTSGSMADEGKMEKARAALLFGVRTLRSGDRFNVVGFAGEERPMESGLIDANEQGKKKGEAFIEKLRPTGGTNINDSLIASIKQFDNSERPKMLVFMTDGLPTVGETDTDKIIENLRKAKKFDVRIFPFGFGYDVNTALLDKLGSENKGVSDYVQPKEDLELKVSNFFAKVSSPVLADLQLDLGPVETENAYPRKLNDLFKGMQMTVIGRYKNETDLKNITARLTGKTGKETRTFTYPGLGFPMRSDDNDFLPRLWASRRVGWLIEQIRLNGESKELRDEVTELGTRYGIVTPYTSYLATDGSARQMTRFEMRQRPAASMRSMRKDGAEAVQMSVQQNAMQANIAVSDESKGSKRILIGNTDQSQFFGGKNFNNEKGVWVDAEYDATEKLPETVLKFASEEYFKIAFERPELAGYFSLGERVIVVFKGRVYRVEL